MFTCSSGQLLIAVESDLHFMLSANQLSFPSWVKEGLLWVTSWAFPLFLAPTDIFCKQQYRVCGALPGTGSHCFCTLSEDLGEITHICIALYH